MNESFADSCLTAWLRHRKLPYYYNKPVGICQALFSEKNGKRHCRGESRPAPSAISLFRSFPALLPAPSTTEKQRNVCRARRFCRRSCPFVRQRRFACGFSLPVKNSHGVGSPDHRRPRVSLRFRTEIPVCHILCTGGKKRSAKAEGVAKRAAKPLFPPERAQKTPLCTPLPEEPQRNGVPAGTPNKTSHRASPSLSPEKSDTGYPFSCENNKKGAKRPESPRLNGRPFPSRGRRVSAGEAPPRRPLPTR